MVSPFLLNQNSQQRSQIHKPLSLTNRLMCYFCVKNDDHKKDIDYNQANIFSTSALQDKFDSLKAQHKEYLESKILSFLIESILEVEQIYHGLVALNILKQANNVFKLEFQEQQKWTSQGDKIGFLRKPSTQWHSNQILTISEQNLLNTWITFQKNLKRCRIIIRHSQALAKASNQIKRALSNSEEKNELDLQLFFIIQYMLANLRCQTYHPEELITSVCVHTYCRCKIRLTCQKCIAENLHKKDPGYQSCNIWDPDRVMDVLMQYLTYYQIKVELIGTEVLEIQIKILRQVVQVLEDSFSQIESLNNFLAKANNYIEETGNREIDKIIFDVAVLENKSIQEYIYETRETLIKMYEQIKHNPKLPPSKITNKESLELIDRFKQLIADKQGLFKNYCSYKDEYQDYVNEELEFIEDRNIKITQQPIPQKKAKDKLKEKINKQQTEEQNQKQQFQQQQQNQYDFIQLGNSLMNKQDLQTAKSAYKLEIKLNPDNPMAYKKLGECLIGQNKFAKAIAVYEKFQGSELEQIPFHILKAQALIKGDKQLEARSLLFNMIKKYPQSKELKDELMKMKK